MSGGERRNPRVVSASGKSFISNALGHADPAQSALGLPKLPQPRDFQPTTEFSNHTLHREVTQMFMKFLVKNCVAWFCFQDIPAAMNIVTLHKQPYK